MTALTLCMWTAVATGLAVPQPSPFPGVDAQRLDSLHRVLVQAAGADAIAAGAGEPAPSPEPPLPADLAALQKTAETAFDDADFPAATAAGRKLVAALEGRLVEVGGVTALLEARLSLANAYLASDEPILARAELDVVARMRPALSVDLRRWPPNLVEAVDAAKARAAAEPAAELSLKVEPAGAVVFVDGLRVGTSPGNVQLRRGTHLVWTGAPAHKADVRVISLEAGSRTVHDVALVAEPLDASLRALRAELFVGGRKNSALAAAQALRKELGASGVLVTALASGPDAPVLLAALVDDNGARAGAASLSTDAQAAALVALLVAAPPAAPPEVRLTDAAKEVFALDFGAHLLGAVPAAAEQDDGGSLFASPIFWGAVGGTVLLTASAVAAVVLLQPEPVVEQGPAQTRVLVEAVP